MNIPRFTADASLYKTRERYQSAATLVDSCRDNEVIAQTGRERAQKIRDTLGFGKVHCISGDCLAWGPCGYDPNEGNCCLYRDETCYWWPS